MCFYEKSGTVNRMRGFSLVELLVSIGIISMLSGMLLFSYSGAFGGRTELTSITQDIALAFREAQVYSTSVREATSGSGSFVSYGIFMDPPGGANPQTTSLILFADRCIAASSVGRYTFSGALANACTSPAACPGGGPRDLCLNQYVLERGHYISNVQQCPADPLAGACSGLNRVDTTFLRPDLQARFDSSPSFNNGSAYLQFRVNSPRSANLFKTIQVWRNGQIVSF